VRRRTQGTATCIREKEKRIEIEEKKKEWEERKVLTQ
jgi:hypothetical protein